MTLSVSQARHVLRTSLSVDQAEGRLREIIVGERFAWSFRPHYHAGDEVVHMQAGQALLRIGRACRKVEVGETVTIPAGIVHHFEPLDAKGWGFASEFLTGSNVNLDGASRSGEESDLVARIRALLAERYSLRTDVARIAEACAMSIGYLSRRFRHEAGTSLHDFHVLVALHNAKFMLKGGYPIVEAALDTGFYDQAHLTRDFVKTYGFTPGAFRAAWRIATRH